MNFSIIKLTRVNSTKVSIETLGGEDFITTGASTEGEARFRLLILRRGGLSRALPLEG
jgi:hypothetical protein